MSYALHKKKGFLWNTQSAHPISLVVSFMFTGVNIPGQYVSGLMPAGMNDLTESFVMFTGLAHRRGQSSDSVMIRMSAQAHKSACQWLPRGLRGYLRLIIDGGDKEKEREKRAGLPHLWVPSLKFWLITNDRNHGVARAGFSSFRSNSTLAKQSCVRLVHPAFEASHLVGLST